MPMFQLKAGLSLKLISEKKKIKSSCADKNLAKHNLNHWIMPNVSMYYRKSMYFTNTLTKLSVDWFLVHFLIAEVSQSKMQIASVQIDMWQHLWGKGKIEQ